MTKDELVNNSWYKFTDAEISAADKLYPDDDNLCTAFEEGALWCIDWITKNLPIMLSNERKIWIDKCCDVVRNTGMNDDLRNDLIDAFKRL